MRDTNRRFDEEEYDPDEPGFITDLFVALMLTLAACGVILMGWSVAMALLELL